MKGCGCVDINQLLHIANITRDYLAKRVKQTKLFKISNNKLFYKSKTKLIPNKIIQQYRRITRPEKISNQFLKNFTCNKNLTSYIMKCYAEHHQHKEKIGRRKYLVRGVVSAKDISDYFKISESSTSTNLKRARVRGKLNIREYRNITFKSKLEFENWMLNHFEQTLDGQKISDNPRCYFLKRINQTQYCLTQRLPNFYPFTGATSANLPKRGQ